MNLVGFLMGGSNRINLEERVANSTAMETS